MRREGLPNEMWSDGEQFILYTEDGEVIRAVRGWNAFQDGRVRQMATYYRGPGAYARGLYYAVQFRFKPSMRRRACRIAGLPEPERKPISEAQLAARRASGKARQAKRSLEYQKARKPVAGGSLASGVTSNG
jgi:hypothetical protein